MLSLLFWDPQQHHWRWGQGIMGPTMQGEATNAKYYMKHTVTSKAQC